MTYDISLLSNQTSILGLMQVANTYTGDLLGIFLVVIIGVALYLQLNTFAPQRQAIVGTLFVTMIIGLLLTIMGLLPTAFFIVLVILLIGAVVFLINTD